MRPNWSATKRPRRPPRPRVWRYRHQRLGGRRTPPPPNLVPAAPPDRPPPLARIFAEFDFENSRRPPMNIDEKCSTPDITIPEWPEKPPISAKTMSARHLRRRRAEAREKWPMYMADVAYRIECLPQPRRRHRRTWEQVARDSFLASFPPGIPPWACEALKPEFSAAHHDAQGDPRSLGKSKSHF